ncbi:integrase core domain-containing protein [Corynebacterium freneyi]|uniref:integrase core domain-containing protein n=1 Tax=Corynebacterium freneyi TaxID=134034 RepID=UPI003D76479E
MPDSLRAAAHPDQRTLNREEPTKGRWLRDYNHHRPHSACGGLPPVSRLTNLPGQYS